MVIATPDFGTGAALSAILVLAWGVVLLTAGVGLRWAVKLLQNKSREQRGKGRLIVLACCLIPFLCCLGPLNAVRDIYGNYPVWGNPHSKIRKGMTKDEVKAALGAPHEQLDRGDGESW